MMSIISTELKENVLTVTMCSRIDTNNAEEVRREIDAVCANEKISSVVVDAAKLEYISSIGLRILLGLRKKFDKFRVINVSDSVYEIFDTTKFTDLMDVEKVHRNISIENCPEIGKGACGTVYKLDDETVVKVFYSDYEYEKIVTERDNSRKAFANGINTAIPFDIVKVGENYGLIYEIINAESLLNLMTKERDKLGYYTEIYADYVKKMHKTTFESGCYPDIRTIWCEKFKNVESFLTSEETDIIKKCIMDIPDRNTFVHGDINFGNLMYGNSEAILIDMDKAALGHPIYDIAVLYYSHKLLPNIVPPFILALMSNFSADELALIWNKFCEIYFDCKTDAERCSYEDEIYPYAILRMLEYVPYFKMVYECSDDKVKNALSEVYKPAVQKYKDEFFEIVKNGLKPITF